MYREQIGGCQRMAFGGWGNGEDGQSVQTSSYKIGKSWWYKNGAYN